MTWTNMLRCFKCLYVYSRWIGFRDAAFCVFSEMRNSILPRLVTMAGERLYIRTATPDIHIAADVLLDHEYDYIECPCPSVIVDAGAYIGVFSIYCAKKYPSAMVYAIEPEKDNYEILLKNTKRFKNIIPIRAAIYGEDGMRTVLDRQTGPWGYTVADTQNQTESTGQAVECLTMTSFMKNCDIDSIDILKLDIEGSEKSVLEGSEAWIDKVGVITVELHDRITPGCEAGFYLATRHFGKFEKNGEKVTAYRE